MQELESHKLNSENIFRETKLRFLGYANEIGEAFRYHIPRALVTTSYGIAFGYGLVDAIWRARFAFERGSAGRPRDAFLFSSIAFVDTLLWQILATVLIPGFTINRIVYFTTRLVNTQILGQRLPSMVKSWGPTAIGLGSIPMIYKPIDDSVTYITSKYFHPYIEKSLVKLIKV